MGAGFGPGHFRTKIIENSPVKIVVIQSLVSMHEIVAESGRVVCMPKVARGVVRQLFCALPKDGGKVFRAIRTEQNLSTHMMQT